MYLLALNCGSSSIKGKLYSVEKGKALELAAQLSVTNIGSKGDKVHLKLRWEGGRGEDVDKDAEDGSEVEHKDIFPRLLKHLAGSGGVKAEEIEYITHRIVHGGTNSSGLKVTKEHHEALEEMDALSEFAPLHNHHAVLCVRACLDSVPKSTNLLFFDTQFHSTLPREVYTYALPEPEEKTAIPLRKYGFHGLSYASIVHTLAKKLDKKAEDVNIVVAHLGSGASACCIKGGKSIDTSMGLTPLEGLVGGTRTGSIDPTAILHFTRDYASDAGLQGMKVTKAEYIMNKKSGLSALAGTSNFGTITERANDKSAEGHEAAKLTYDVFLDRLMAFVTQYLAKLLADMPLLQIDGLVFAGGIGEHAEQLRADVGKKLGWLGVEIDQEKNKSKISGVGTISSEGSKLGVYVVETDEEGWCALLAREMVGI